MGGCKGEGFIEGEKFGFEEERAGGEVGGGVVEEGEGDGEVGGGCDECRRPVGGVGRGGNCWLCPYYVTGSKLSTDHGFFPFGSNSILGKVYLVFPGNSNFKQLI